MKRILITGLTGYIGTTLHSYLRQQSDPYQIDMVSVRNDDWRKIDFSLYDSIVHAAGIAHRKETKENAQSYYDINRDLAISLAEKAKVDGCPHFVFISSMSVYGMDTGVITKETKPMPKSHYGKSKLQAEVGIAALDSCDFRVCILRPPMVYGKDCKGNFQSIVKLVKKLPVFPVVRNERSMIFIDNLCVFIKFCIDNQLQGLYLPQNREYMSTTEMAKLISGQLEKKVFFSKLLGCAVLTCRPFIHILQKAFGSLIYMDTEVLNYQYCLVDIAESIKQSI